MPQISFKIYLKIDDSTSNGEKVLMYLIQNSIDVYNEVFQLRQDRCWMVRLLDLYFLETAQFRVAKVFFLIIKFWSDSDLCFFFKTEIDK